MRPFRVVVVSLALVAIAAEAAAQGICNAHYPIRATGAACNSANAVGHITRPTDGVVVCCIGSPQSSSPRGGTVNVPSATDRYAAGLALGAAGLGIVSDLIDMIERSSASQDAAPPRHFYRDRLAQEREDARLEAARWYEAAVYEIRKGDMHSAEGFLAKAVKLAAGGTEYELRDRYQLELNAVKATQAMKEGLALEAEGRPKEALQRMDMAAYWAEQAGRKDLHARIRQYRETLRAAGSGTRAGRTGSEPGERSTCLQVNGELICE